MMGYRISVVTATLRSRLLNLVNNCLKDGRNRDKASSPEEAFET
jgi:hypothetical protein